MPKLVVRLGSTYFRTSMALAMTTCSMCMRRRRRVSVSSHLANSSRTVVAGQLLSIGRIRPFGSAQAELSRFVAQPDVPDLLFRWKLREGGLQQVFPRGAF